MIVYLKPCAPFANSAPRSDTLFGAIAWAIRALYGEDELVRLLERFDQALASQSEPPFLVSSLFPYLEPAGDSGEGDSGGHRRTLFLPRPLLGTSFELPPENRNGYRLFKKFQRTDWMSLGVFEPLARGELSETELWAQLLIGPEGRYRLHAGAVMTAEESGIGPALRSLIRTGESVRLGEKPFYAPFAAPQASAHARTGFFFLVRQQEELIEPLKTALRFLGDRGFGGGVSTGRGYCEIEFDDRDWSPGSADGGHLVSFSLLHPSAADRLHFTRRQNDCRARLERRRGVIESAYAGDAMNVWKPTLVMLAEGATFPRDGGRQLYGSIFKERELRRGLSERLRINGLAYTVPMKLPGSDEKEASS
jgi:CRISPR-associated protein Csm4